MKEEKDPVQSPQLIATWDDNGVKRKGFICGESEGVLHLDSEGKSFFVEKARARIHWLK